MVGQSDPDGSRTVAAFDRCGVDWGVIPVVDWTRIGARDPDDLDVRSVHARYDDLVSRWPGRFRYCAGADPRHHDASAIVTEALEQPGCAGLKLYPAAGWHLDDAAHTWLLRLAADAGVPMVVHSCALGGDPLVPARCRPDAVAAAFGVAPDATWVLAHAGFEAWWAEACDVASGWRRVYLDLSLWQAVAFRDYGEFRHRVRLVLEKVGAHRVIFGSDILRGSATDPDGAVLAKWIDRFAALAAAFDGEPPVVSTDELELMFAGNADRVYGAPPT